MSETQYLRFKFTVYKKRCIYIQTTNNLDTNEFYAPKTVGH